jgi:hypothetical protein
VPLECRLDFQIGEPEPLISLASSMRLIVATSA